MKTATYVNVICAVQLCISTEMTTPQKVEGTNTGCPMNPNIVPKQTKKDTKNLKYAKSKT